MRARILLGRRFLRLGAFIETLPLVVMKPDDLVDFSRRTYERPDDVDSWARDDFVDSGLTTEETDLLSAAASTGGDLLLLGVGGGREAIPLARMGFRVTGVDYVPAMVDRARDNAAQRGLTIQGMVQDISRLDVPENAYDVVLVSRAMYSCVPTRKRRVEMVRRIARALRPGGTFLCQFHLDPRLQGSRKTLMLRRVIAACTLGNFAYQDGDILWQNLEFIHAFLSKDEVTSELEDGGLVVEEVRTDTSPDRCGAICRKMLPAS